jgi:hypothetical protein
LHRLSCSNETVRNALKLLSWVQWSGSGAFVAKIPMRLCLANLCNNGTSSASFASSFSAVTKRSETPQNMRFWSNGVEWVRSLRKIPTQRCLANLCDNGTSSASFASTFVQYRNGPKRPKTWVLGLMEWIGCVRCKKFWRDLV